MKRANQSTHKTPQHNSTSRLNADWDVDAIMLQRWRVLHTPCDSVSEQYFALNITVYYTCQPKTGEFLLISPLPAVKQISLCHGFFLACQLAWVSFNAKTDKMKPYSELSTCRKAYFWFPYGKTKNFNSSPKSKSWHCVANCLRLSVYASISHWNAVLLTVHFSTFTVWCANCSVSALLLSSGLIWFPIWDRNNCIFFGLISFCFILPLTTYIILLAH